MSSYRHNNNNSNRNIAKKNKTNKKRQSTSYHFEADYRISPQNSCTLLNDMKYCQGSQSLYSQNRFDPYKDFAHPRGPRPLGYPVWNKKQALGLQTPTLRKTDSNCQTLEQYPKKCYDSVKKTQKTQNRDYNKNPEVNCEKSKKTLKNCIKGKKALKSRLLLDLSESSSNGSKKEELCNTDCSPVESSKLPLSFQGLSKDNIRVRIRVDRERKFQRSLEALLNKREDLYRIFEDSSVEKEIKRKILCKEGQINWFDGTKDKRGKLLHVFGLRITNAVHKGHNDEINLRFQ